MNTISGAMKVLVSAVSHASGISGVERHALNLVQALRTQCGIREIHVVCGGWQHAVFAQLREVDDHRVQVHCADAKGNAVSRNLWHLRGLPILARDLNVDLVHLTYPVPVSRKAIGRPIVVTLHDLYPYEIPANFGFPKYIANQWITRSCLRAADSIACVSASTEKALARYTDPAIVRKAVHVFNCVEDCHESEKSGLPWLRQPFLLCVAQHRRNKNIPYLLRVLDALGRTGHRGRDMLLVIVGIEGAESKLVHGVIRSLGLERRVRLVQHLSDSELRWCYQNCEALLAPSTTEGFGLPVVEALAQGARVVCSDIPAFREFARQPCWFVRLEGEDPEARFAEAILRSLEEPKPAAQQFPYLSSASVGDAYGVLYRSLQTARSRANRELSVDCVKSGGRSFL